MSAGFCNAFSDSSFLKKCKHEDNQDNLNILVLFLTNYSDKIKGLKCKKVQKTFCCNPLIFLIVSRTNEEILLNSKQ